jgi:hypothetical protein
MLPTSSRIDWSKQPIPKLLEDCHDAWKAFSVNVDASVHPPTFTLTYTPVTTTDDQNPPSVSIESSSIHTASFSLAIKVQNETATVVLWLDGNLVASGCVSATATAIQ